MPCNTVWTAASGVAAGRDESRGASPALSWATADVVPLPAFLTPGSVGADCWQPTKSPNPTNTTPQFPKTRIARRTSLPTQRQSCRENTTVPPRGQRHLGESNWATETDWASADIGRLRMTPRTAGQRTSQAFSSQSLQLPAAGRAWRSRATGNLVDSGLTFAGAHHAGFSRVPPFSVSQLPPPGDARSSGFAGGIGWPVAGLGRWSPAVQVQSGSGGG